MTLPVAVIFDVDGTLVDSERHGNLNDSVTSVAFGPDRTLFATTSTAHGVRCWTLDQETMDGADSECAWREWDAYCEASFEECPLPLADPQAVTKDPARIGIAAAQPGRETEKLTHRARPRPQPRGQP
jgi:beta-phosphoglucomutase-like phosphatase (HAD superfamily)